MLRVAIFARVSTEGQEKDGQSLEVQVMTLRNCVEVLNGTVVKEYVGSESATSGDKKRPILDEILNDARNKEFECLMIYDLSRLTRDPIKSKIILAELKKYNIKLYVQTQLYSLDNPETNLVVGLLSEINAFQVAIQVKKSIESKIELAKKGWSVVGKPPFGRLLKHKDHSKAPEWMIDPESAVFAQKIYNMYIHQGIYVEKIGKLLGTDPTRIYRILKDRGVLKQTFRTDNEILTIETKIPSLYTLEQQEIIKHQFKRNKKENSKKYQYLLSSYVKCSVCGYTFTGCRFEQDRRYYRHSPYGRTQDCPIHIPAKKLDKIVIDNISEIIRNKETLKDIIRKCNDVSLERRQKLLDEQMVIQNKIIKFERQIDKALMMVLEDHITKEQGDRTIKKIQDNLNENKTRLVSVNVELETLSSLDVPDELLEKVTSIFQSLNECYGQSIQDWDFKTQQALVKWFFGVSDKNGVFVRLNAKEITYTINSNLGSIAFGFMTDEDGPCGVTGFESGNTGDLGVFKSIMENIISNQQNSQNTKIQTRIGAHSRNRPD